ncbi:hypothetical protein Y032_0003g1201 [Ancylostoma ceylanicum]|uniref:Uncharacterized protein n=1 Tax=Ancylostoma ceylanicum TaxID=53326 RepID=A0A016VWD2_9BILA|nr:hypothetical protein Y032_0003g1201 [Ancylostoma ceylanicum]
MPQVIPTVQTFHTKLRQEAAGDADSGEAEVMYDLMYDKDMQKEAMLELRNPGSTSRDHGVVTLKWVYTGDLLQDLQSKQEEPQYVLPSATKFGCWMRLGCNCQATLVCVYDKKANGAVKGRRCKDDADCNLMGGECLKWGLCSSKK